MLPYIPLYDRFSYTLLSYSLLLYIEGGYCDVSILYTNYVEGLWKVYSEVRGGIIMRVGMTKSIGS